MSDVYDKHDQTVALYLVDDAVVSYPDTVKIIGALKFFRAGGMRGDGQPANGRVDTVQYCPVKRGQTALGRTGQPNLKPSRRGPWNPTVSLSAHH